MTKEINIFTHGSLRLNISHPVSKLVFAHARWHNTVTESVDDGWRWGVIWIQLWIISVHNLSTARVPDEIDKAGDLGLLIAWNGALGGIADGGTLGCTEVAGVVHVAMVSIFDDLSVSCREHDQTGITGCMVLYVHTLYSYTRMSVKQHAFAG